MMSTPGWTKYFLPPSLSIVMAASIMLFACKPGGETSDIAILPPVSFGVTSDLRAMLVSESNNCLYVADHNNNQISCIDLTTHSINQNAALTITTGKPLAISLAHDATALVVATENGTSDAVEIFLFKNTSSSYCKLPGIPNSIAVTDKNQIYAGVSGTQGSIYSCGTVTAPSLNAVSVPDLNNYRRIAGISNDGTIIFAVSDNMALTTLWDTTTDSSYSIENTVFGEFTSSNPNYGRIVFHPKDHQAYVLTNGTKTDGNFLPTYSVERTPPRMIPITSSLRPPIIPNSLVFLQTLHRAVMSHAAVPLFWAPNQDKLTDLHIFDTDTGEEIARYDVRNYVRENGLAADQHNTIYMLLGEPQATQVGIVTAP